MTMKLFIIALLCASALADGAWIWPTTQDSVLSKYPDFVIIWYQDDQSAFNISFQNAVTAGYKSVHLSLDEWSPLTRENIPENFTGRVWLQGLSSNYRYLVTKVESLANQGFNVGVLDNDLSFDGFVPGVVSSLPYAWWHQAGNGPEIWTPVAGWNCPSIYVRNDEEYDDPEAAVCSCHVNV